MGLLTDLAIDWGRRFGRRDPQPFSQVIARPQRVLCFPAQADGELLMALPAIKALRRHYDDSLLVLLVDDRKRNLWWFDDEVDEIIDFRPDQLRGSGSREFKRLRAIIRQKQFDLLIDFNHSRHDLLSYLFYRSGIKVRFGAHFDGDYPFKNIAVRGGTLPHDEIERNNAMINQLGARRYEHFIHWPRPMINEGRREFKERFQQDIGTRQAVAAEAGVWKRRELHEFLRAADALPGIQLILLNLAEPLPAQLRNTPLVYNSLSTVELAEILRHCQAFIGTKNDDFSIAYFLKVPSLIAVTHGTRGLPAADENVTISTATRRLEFPLQQAKALLADVVSRSRLKQVH
jgi:ADP-heptose:LPS heptosyltransferase